MPYVNSVDAEHFNTHVKGESLPVLVDFWGERCSACVMLSPVLDKIAVKYNGRLKVLKCNVSENQELGIKYGIMTIPNLLFFQNGEVVNQLVGAMSESQLSARIDDILAA